MFRKQLDNMFLYQTPSETDGPPPEDDFQRLHQIQQENLQKNITSLLHLLQKSLRAMPWELHLRTTWNQAICHRFKMMVTTNGIRMMIGVSNKL